MEKTICVDFDGVIHKYSKGWHDGTAYDEPMEGAFDALRKMQKHFTVIIFSTRPAKDIRKWFRHYNQPCPKIVKKPMAMMYIDDRALRFTNWKDVLNYVR